MAMTGTTSSLNRDTLCTPPHIITRVIAASNAAIHSRGKPKQALKASEMVLDCTELKAKPNVSVMSTANVTAHQRLCKPFWI